MSDADFYSKANKKNIDDNEEDESSQSYGNGLYEADSLPSFQGTTLSPRQQDGSNGDAFFSFIREAHLHEAQEFRHKGYNNQIPEVDPMLLPLLREATDIASRLIHLHASEDGKPDRSWLLVQIHQLKKFIERLSGEDMQEWVKDELTKERLGTNGLETSLNKRTSQSLVRRLTSTLQTLTRVAQMLGTVVNYSTPKNLHDAVHEELVNELTDAIAPGDRESVMLALSRMTADDAGKDALSSLKNSRVMAWESRKPATFDTTIAIMRQEADKANKKARELSGLAQTFFSDIATFLLHVSREFKIDRSASDHDAVPAIKEKKNDDKMAFTQRVNKKINTRFREQNLKLDIVRSTFSRYWRVGNRVIQHGEITNISSKPAEQIVADSIARSILWQWQQPAIKLQQVSNAISVKVTELKNIQGLFFSSATDSAPENADKVDDILASKSSDVEDDYSGLGFEDEDEDDFNEDDFDDDDFDTRVRQWVEERIEQEQPEGLRAAKLAVLNQLLDADIASARKLVWHLGKTQENIENMLRRQHTAVMNMIYRRHSAEIDTALKAVNKLLPEIAKGLTATVTSLDKALQAAKAPARNFSEAKKHTNEAQLLAINVKELISTQSARLTEQSLDEHSRGSRLAKHWANLAKEQNRGHWQATDATSVRTSLKNEGLLDGTLSHADPEGYLFATRLAGELENARNDELKLPMSPEEYLALEKSLAEFIVRWGEKRLARGGASLWIELIFEQAVDTVTFGLSSMLRTPYKVMKATIKIPYKVNKVNKYTMPGQDKPYKAMYAIFTKSLKNMGFNLIMSPVAGVIKLPIGAGIMAGAALYNKHLDSKEKTFSAVYERVADGKKSEKIKTSDLQGMLLDSGLDAAIIGGVKGGRKTIVTRPKVINTQLPSQLISDDEGGRQEITHNGSGVIIIKGDRAFRSAVQQHIEEIKKHPSGRALLKKVQHHKIEIRPAHNEDWLRTEQGGQHYFGSRIVGNTIYFDPYNTFYGSSREEQENWRDLHPSIVLFHELLHLDSGDAGHDTIIPSDPNRLDENDFRREFYASYGKEFIMRPLNEYQDENNRKFSRYAPVRKNTSTKFSESELMHEYKNMSMERKRLTYYHAINDALQNITNDISLSEHVRLNAYKARTGISILSPVNFYGHTLKNVFFIPDKPGAKTGLLVDLDSVEKPYIYVRTGSDIPVGLRNRLLGSAFAMSEWVTEGVTAFDRIREGHENWPFDTYFNYQIQQELNIYQLSEHLEEDIEKHYQENPKRDHNKRVVQKAITGTQLSKLDVSTIQMDFKLQFTWAALTPSDYLRSFSRPFTTLSGQGQLIASHISEDSIENTEKKVEKAQYIGQWIDVTAGAATSFSGAGIVLGAMQSAAEIAADIAEGKDPDPLAVAGLLLNSVPGEKIGSKIGKFSKIGERVFKFSLQLGQKLVDLTEMGLAIKQAIKSGDPLDIYNALLVLGMSSIEAHDTSQKIFEQISNKGTSINGNTRTGSTVKPQKSSTDVPVSSAGLKEQIMPRPTGSRRASGRKFKLGSKELMGRKNGKLIEISNDNGTTWQKGSNVHMLAFALQNAGGKSKLPNEGSETVYSDDQQPGTSAQAVSQGEANFIRHLEQDGDPNQYFSRIRNRELNSKVKIFKYFHRFLQGRVRNGVFEVSRDNGDTWKRGGWLQEAVYRFRGREQMRVNQLDNLINKASRPDPRAYSQICYRAAINNAGQAGVISSGARDWLTNEVTAPAFKGEIIHSDEYRNAFGLPHKKAMTDFSSANINQSGFIHIGKIKPDGTAFYSHVGYVHVDKTGIYIYQVNGETFLGALQGDDPLNKNNNIGPGVSESHYKHKMDGNRINSFNDYFTPKENDKDLPSVFTFTPASEVQEAYVRHISELMSSDSQLNTDGLVTGKTYTFEIKKKKFMGKVKGGKIMISNDNGETWKKGSNYYLAILRLQNAGAG